MLSMKGNFKRNLTNPNSHTKSNQATNSFSILNYQLLNEKKTKNKYILINYYVYVLKKEKAKKKYAKLSVKKQSPHHKKNVKKT